MRAFVFVMLVAMVAGCGGSGQAKLKGQLFKEGEEKLSLADGEQAFMSLVKVTPDGKPDLQFSYPCAVNPDGSFEMVASGGELPPGNYRVSVEVLMSKGTTKEGRPKQTPRFGGKFSAEQSPVKVEIAPGENDVKITIPVK